MGISGCQDQDLARLVKCWSILQVTTNLFDDKALGNAITWNIPLIFTARSG